MWKYSKVFAKIFQSIWRYSKIFRPAASLDAAVLYIRVKSHGNLQPLLLIVEILNKAVQPKVERSIAPRMVALPRLVHFEAPPAHLLLLLLDGHLPHQDLLLALHEADQLAWQLQPLNLEVLVRFNETLEHNFLESKQILSKFSKILLKLPKGILNKFQHKLTKHLKSCLELCVSVSKNFFSQKVNIKTTFN